MNIYTATTKGYALDQHGRKHFSIHPRVFEGGTKSNTACKFNDERTTSPLAKALARRNARRNANGTYNSGSKFADHMAGSMKK